MVESRRPDLASAVGDVAGGVTELITIVGVGMHCTPESICPDQQYESPELVDGLCSMRKLGSSTANESRLPVAVDVDTVVGVFFVAAMIFGVEI